MANKFYNNLVSHWLMNDDLATTAVLDTTGVNDGVLNVNTDTISVTGKIKKALEFDGVDDYIEIADSDSLDLGTGDFSISIWIYPTNNDSNRIFFVKAGGWAVGQATNGILINAGANKIGFETRDGTNRNILLTSSGTITLNAWHHIVVTRDAGVYRKIYIDGVEQATTDVATSVDVTNAIALRISYDNRDTRRFIGKIDDVRIYDTAISAYYVKLLYNNGAGTEDENVQSNTLLLGCNF